MRPTWFLAVTLAQSLSATAQSTDADILQGIRSDYPLTPAIAAYRNRGGEIQKEAVGVRKRGDPTEVEITDQFHMGYLSDAMTSTLLGIFVDEGILDWDTTLPDAFPQLAGDMHEGFRNVTVDMVAAHHSGFGSYLGDGFLDRLYGLSPVEGRDLMTSRFLTQPPHVTIWNYYHYATTNYLFLAKSLETLVGEGEETFEDIMTTRLFEPLGMECGFGSPPESSETSVDNPWGHDFPTGTSIPLGGQLIRRVPPPAFAATQIHCDLESHAKFTQFHLDSFNGRPTPLNLSPETIEKFFTLHSNQSNTTYGGWVVPDPSEHPWANGPSFRYGTAFNISGSHTVLAPSLGERGESIAAFVNTDDHLGTMAPATAAYTAAIDAMANGTLFP
ncbi:hypothetical protein FQN54_009904 [Arachnomyces sp. PD_36]|nr:hypothetical protein FQN54_009904 [Arachnomyces sp. PD_36]